MRPRRQSGAGPAGALPEGDPAGTLGQKAEENVPNLGMGELVVILLICLLVFGANRLPQIGEGLGKAIKGLKRGLSTDDDIEVTSKDKRVAARSSAEPVSEAKSEVAEAEVVERKG